MNLKNMYFLAQKPLWPMVGKHILAQFDETSIVVYQAYPQNIGEFAIHNQYFGGDFSYSRFSWIKTNFLWMMFRSGWGTKPGQEMLLAIRIRRTFFDSLLSQAVESTWNTKRYKLEKEWKHDIARSSVRLQWDPDHNPSGGKLTRRAIQLGLRNNMLKDYGKHQILEIIDMTDFVRQQRAYIKDLQYLMSPTEEIYRPTNDEICNRIGIDS